VPYGDGYACIALAGMAVVTTGRLAGQVALVTGGGSGIGAATARRLAAEGAAVAVSGRRREPLTAVASGLGPRALALPADAANPGEMAGVVATVADRLGPVSILVANAGGEGGGTAADVTDAAWQHSMRMNLDTCLVTARACLPGLITSRGCAIVVSSIAGLAASPESVGYVTAKHALIGLTRSMARDFGPRGVRVNAVCPGWVRTPMADAEMDQLARLRGLPGREAAYALATSQVPLRRPCTPEEVASVIAFLASADAAAVTGVTLAVDAGATAVDLPTIAFDLA
jgi:meso-butanediol dehydrogenase / (S,S)-butanediol dehydrogenase / diacetyl reductase